MMKVKVCGVRNKSNLDFLNQSSVDFIGFIFYAKSSRYFFDGDISQQDLMTCKKKKVGVFVNESIDKIEEVMNAYGLDVIQLHGDESPEDCQALKSKGYRLVKAFSVGTQLPVELSIYEPFVDYFLFDTKGKWYGGNGAQFDWSVLENYPLDKPFILSGGIGLEDVEEVKKINHSELYAIDVNSRLEVLPGLKDEVQTMKFLEELKK